LSLQVRGPGDGLGERMPDDGDGGGGVPHRGHHYRRHIGPGRTQTGDARLVRPRRPHRVAADRVRERHVVSPVGEDRTTGRDHLKGGGDRLANRGGGGLELHGGRVRRLPGLGAVVVGRRRTHEPGTAHPLDAEREPASEQSQIVARVDTYARPRRRKGQYGRAADKASAAGRTYNRPGRGRRETVRPCARGPTNQPATLPISHGRHVGGSAGPASGSREASRLGLRRLAVDVSGHYGLVIGAGAKAGEQEFLLAVDYLPGP
jgi:hypothetical protein